MCLHSGMRNDPGCGVTGEHQKSADVQVKCHRSGKGFLHMVVEARMKHDIGNSVLRDNSEDVLFIGDHFMY